MTYIETLGQKAKAAEPFIASAQTSIKTAGTIKRKKRIFYSSQETFQKLPKETGSFFKTFIPFSVNILLTYEEPSR